MVCAVGGVCGPFVCQCRASHAVRAIAVSTAFAFAVSGRRQMFTSSGAAGHSTSIRLPLTSCAAMLCCASTKTASAAAAAAPCRGSRRAVRHVLGLRIPRQPPRRCARPCCVCYKFRICSHCVCRVLSACGVAAWRVC